MAEEVERIYVIPLRRSGFKSSKSAPAAIKRVRNYLTRHMKVEKKNIWIDDSLNNALWSQGKYKMPSKIRVKAVKFDDGVVEAYIPELEIKKSRRELLKEEREKKEPILKKEEVEPGEAEGEVPGAEDYDIAPTADGEVKIKKKKTPKEKPKKAKKPAKTKKEPKEKKEKAKKPAKKKAEPKKKMESKPKTTKKAPSKPKSTKKKSSSKKNKK
jgi:large subunit ribosomal protein L31e